MEFSVERSRVRDMAKKANKIAQNYLSIEELRGILIECNQENQEIVFTATDFESSLELRNSANVSNQEGSIIVNASLLFDILDKLAGEIVYFSSKDSHLVQIVSGSCKYEISCKPGKNYPKPIMPFPDETVRLKGICTLAKKTVFVSSKDKNKPILQCVSINIQQDNIFATATDGTSLVYTKNNATSAENFKLLVPASSLQTLATISTDHDEYEVGIANGKAVFTTKQMLFSMSMMQGTFIDPNTVVKSIVPHVKVIIPVTELCAALETVLIAGNIVQLTVQTNEISFEVQGEKSESKTAINAKIQGNVRNSFYYNATSILKLCHILSGTVQIILDEKGFMLIKNATEIFFQMPMIAPRKHIDSPNSTDKKEAA